MPNETFRLLNKALNNQILVKLKDGHEYIGNLVRYDQTMNLVLTDAIETIDNGSPLAKYGKVLVRGSNILYIVTSPAKEILQRS
ncbi:MAG: Sm ribonucleo [Candidatus Methanomethylicota archaeon]|jgi:small nuclear ribonucleoprotein|uniref:Sm ribonucleo n=1 Tax=Thermoproteota archaeon TaxID=2056631 RepID=A0A520KFT4_9CREN|nr:ribonucleoprotein [Candidatus Methanomethylicia archaeon]RZN56365.1 MAG: Sm ribonucleo [Candidatus Verstraetearchaeota archaeon]TDA40025.1 MAG: Sm ribonucleo [Candidatus Verstraetearchaeota archaeon]